MSDKPVPNETFQNTNQQLDSTFRTRRAKILLAQASALLSDIGESHEGLSLLIEECSELIDGGEADLFELESLQALPG